MHLINEVVNYVDSLPASTWPTLGSYLGGSTLVAAVLQITKHKFKFADAQKLVVFALGFFSFLAAFADFIIQANPNLSALPWLGQVTAALMGFAVVIHRFAVSPLYYRLASKLNQFNGLLKEAEKEELVSPAPVVKGMPAPALPIPDEVNLSQFQV